MYTIYRSDNGIDLSITVLSTTADRPLSSTSCERLTVWPRPHTCVTLVTAP